MNLLAYLLYLFLTYLITVKAGWSFYKHGRVFILAMLRGNELLTDYINRMLLIGYYLLNLGYAALMLSTWKTLVSLDEVLLSVAKMTGLIMLLLAVMHFFNMAVLYFIGSRKKLLHHFKK